MRVHSEPGALPGKPGHRKERENTLYFFFIHSV